MLRLARWLGISLAIVSLPLVLGFGACGPDNPPPPAPRGCDSPASMAEITELEVGGATGAFVPSAIATPMTGGQGFDMLGYRFAVRATGPIDCIALSDGNLSVEASGDWYVTDPTWRITGSDTILVTVEAYGMRVQREMSATPRDAGAPEVDAGEVTVDGGEIDAGTP